MPFGLHFKGVDRILSFNGYDLKSTNHTFSDDLKEMFQNIIDEETLNHIKNGEFDEIAADDKKSIDDLFGENKKYKSYKSAQALVSILDNYYKISKVIAYKTVILDWNREKSRFYIKEKIKNDAPQMSFLEFIRQLPFLVAVC